MNRRPTTPAAELSVLRMPRPAWWAAPAAGAASRRAGHAGRRTRTTRRRRTSRGAGHNPWFPLVPGTGTSIGAHGRATRRDVLIATYRTRVVDGVTCRVVFDRVWSNGGSSERTHDFYAQTRAGTVWYFGERTATLDRHGHVNEPRGLVHVGRRRRRGRHLHDPPPARRAVVPPGGLPGHAEDVFTVVRRGAHVSVPSWTPGTRCSPGRRPRSSPGSSTTSTTCATSARSAR